MKAYTQLSKARIDLAKAIPLPKPLSLLFEPACMCNFRCTCCYYGQEEASRYLGKGRMSLNNFTKLAADLENWEGDKIKVLRFIGFGEPLLNCQTPEMIRYIKEKNLAERVEMTTNGSLLTQDVATRLIETGLDYIRISVYAATERRHREITHGRVSADTIFKSVASLRQLRDSLGTGRPFIYAKMLEHPEAEENQRFFDLYGGIADEVALERRHNWLEEPSSSLHPQRIVCPQPFKMMSVRYNGDVIMCDPDWQGNTLVGNALREGLRGVWTGPRVRDFWELQLRGTRRKNKSCKTCSFINNPNYVLDDIDCLATHDLDKGYKNDA